MHIRLCNGWPAEATPAPAGWGGALSSLRVAPDPPGEYGLPSMTGDPAVAPHQSGATPAASVDREVVEAGVQLPMAVAGCGLDPAALRAQADRYRRLGAVATSIDHEADRVRVSFAAGVDSSLLAAAIATERGCCPSLALDYDPGGRRLTITASGPDGRAALGAIMTVLGPAGPRATP